MLNYNKINGLHKGLNEKEKDFYLKIEMTYDGYLKMTKNKRMKVETLEKIAKYFDKPISWFFDEEGEESTDIVSEPKEAYSFEEKYNKLMEKHIAALEKIEFLKDEKNKSPKKSDTNIY